jgi:predicted aminopeptidase
LTELWACRLRAACALALVLATTGCLQVGYLVQAAKGQDDISYRTRPIDEVLADGHVSEHTRSMLSLIGDVKAFGERHGIEATDNYREYVKLDRPVVVYVVSASHPLRFASKTWWFPIVGSVPYLGWFDKRSAQRYAKELEEEGWDVDLRGARAYSTLGWFDDPILSTMIRPRPSVVGDMVNVVLHESVHATHYVNSQSAFNESLADYVADSLTDVYLRDRLQVDRWELLAYAQSQMRREKRQKRFHEVHVRLEKLYASKLSDEDKLHIKKRITSQLRTETNFWRPINNATLANTRTYHGANGDLDELFRLCGRDWRRFWKAVKTIDEDTFDKPQQRKISAVIETAQKRCGESRP